MAELMSFPMTNKNAPINFPAPSSIPEMPAIYRVTTIRHTRIDTRRTESTATLFHEKAAIRVTWTSGKPDSRITVNDIVSPRWQAHDTSGDGRIPINRLVLLERPEPMANLFDTVPPGWIRDRDLVRQARELIDDLPRPYRHLFNAIFWSGERFRRFCKGPSSRHHHHCGENGNLSHSVDVAKTMRDLCRTRDGTHADLGILLGLLHDAGKADEYRLGANGDWVMTDQGILVGHERTRDDWIAVALERYRIAITDRQRLAITHCLTAKQNAPEWLGLRRPVMLEAFLLSHADRMSGDAELIGRSAANDGAWGKYVEPLKARAFVMRG